MAITAWPCLAHAQSRPVQELLQTELVYAQDAGELQVTAGATGFGAAHAVDLPLAVEYGITDAWQIGAEWRGFARGGAAPHGGLAELAVATKYSFMNLGGRPLHAAIGLELEAPRGAGAEDEPTRIAPMAAVAMDVHRWRNTHLFAAASAGYAVRRADAASRDVAPAISGGAIVPFRRWSLATEVSYERQAELAELFVTPSIIVDAGHSWQVVVGTPIRAAGDGDRLALSVLFTYER